MATGEICGGAQPVQRCRDHKVHHVLGELPQNQRAQTLNLMRVAWQLTDADEEVKQLARFLEHDDAAAVFGQVF